MISIKTVKSLEFDRILEEVISYSVLEKTKTELLNFTPLSNLKASKLLLEKTEEAFKLLYTYSLGGIFYCSDVFEQLDRVDKGGVLNNGELLKVRDNLKSSRLLLTSINSVNDESIVQIKEIASRLILHQDIESEITSKIISNEEVDDNASPKLYSIRKSIRDINAKIRNRLNSYIRRNSTIGLQDAVVTIRQGRYVIPVKSEFRSQIKGFIHDQSSSGATVFIEPEDVIEANNELKKAYLDEADEIYNILRELSIKVASISNSIRYNYENLVEIDGYYSRAHYSFINKCSKPTLNDNGFVNIIKGRHPLIDKNKVVPVSLSLGKDYNFLLLSGPNTGGKTVTLKLTGLFALMSMFGLFIPAEEGSSISVFNGIYSDIGDEQSIEQSLSTFSSHLKNIIEIINSIDDKSLVLIDELGAGTDPEEGSALAHAIIKKLLEKKCYGIITTHYSRLKEFAMNQKGIINSSMEFCTKTLKPLYKLNIGIPGSSNALEIATSLGLDIDVIKDAKSFLTDDKISFESILKKAEDSRQEYQRLAEETANIKLKQQEELQKIQLEKEKIIKEKEKISFNAKQETKRIVSDKLAEAEEIIAELKTILKKAELESKDVFKANELKNRLKNSRYLGVTDTLLPFQLQKAKESEVKIGVKVFVKSLDAYAKVVSIKNNKKEVEVLIGNIKSVVKFSDLFNVEEIKEEKNKVNVKREFLASAPITEINVIGKTSLEALTEIQYFMDSAVVNNLAEVKIIHGVGSGVLIKTVREYLKSNKNVKEFRRGKYGEGENGVTIVTMK